MTILAIDPGFERVGIALIEKKKGAKEEIIFSECFHTDKKEAFAVRLNKIGNKIKNIIEEFKPEALAIETLFLNTNQKTVMHVAEARGVIVYESTKQSLSIFEYTPLQVKIAVCGYGRATKDQVMAMVQKIITLKEKKNSDDELDAIAIGLTCVAHEKF